MAVDPLRVGVIGTGALGRHHVRIFSSLPGVELVGIHDADPVVARRVGEQHGARVFDAFDDLGAAIDAAVLAVPTVEHARLGRELLDRGVHLMVEKPIAASLEEADALIEAAKRRGRVLVVGHVEFFNPAVQRLLETETTVRFAEVQRLGVFSPRSLDIDVILDLMIHDLQILHALDASPVAEIRATGIHVLSDKVDIANVRLELESGMVANLTASRVSSEKVRKLRLFMPDCYYSLDYQEQELKGYRLARDGDARRIERADLDVEPSEPLLREGQAFAARCRGEAVPVVTGEEGRRALETALAVMDALKG